MREHFRKNKPVLMFTLAWFVLNLLQGYFTEILEDEAYYWLYSEFPAWGYFDHPPMVALLVRLGYALIPNELGVRLLFSLLGAGTVYITWHLIPERSRKAGIFIWSILAISLMHLNVAGFTALPDIPLVFFASLFYLLLKKYLDEDHTGHALLIGIVAAFMMYSKYHALLILFFTLLSFWRLLLRRSFWLIVITALILYLPHLIWQVRNDFVSFEYHLVSRNDPFQPRQILEYIGNQLLVTGPFVGVILLYLAFSRKSRDRYERMLKFNLIGFFGFFLISSLRGHVEPHWTAAAFPPLLTLAMVNVGGYPRLQRWLRSLSIATIPVILLIRTYLVWNILPLPHHVTTMFHDKDIWTSEIEEKAGDLPVIFINKFQRPSVYWFYSGKTAFTRNNIGYRRNQFDLWPVEAELEGRKVMLTRRAIRDSTRTFETVHGEIRYYIVDRYCSFNRLKIKALNKTTQAVAGQAYNLAVRISNPTPRTVSLDCECDLPPLLMCTYQDENRKNHYFTIDPQPFIGSIGPGEAIELDLTLPAPAGPGEYRVLISFGSEILLPGINGTPALLRVTALREEGLARNRN